MNLRRISGVLVGTLGLALFLWLLFDASAIVSTLHLSNYVSEAVVAVAAMVIAAACIAAALFSFRSTQSHGARALAAQPRATERP